ncbi:metallophosphoesterase family protein [Deinococcus hopiensis]|uniref:Calcineurin-like phosphoesterase superfamily domain-containing protein n=1 Tax=Deinococcus hopiensis KR-140 TaxID=695939 RepID=A0A1W1UM77_9DEIO|nr:DNA repair exonuclease [Deinococcus hopiensis]SMB82099.1 Calcineurin-like phosphoesterase superfamily domain-containing protein [Deinococcus hopiensis KR-140]
MTSFSFAHVADLHLDTPFSGLASVNEQLAQRLRDASLDAWDRVVQACVDRQVAFLVIAGDIYDSDTASVRAQLRFLRGLERLSQAGIQSFIVHGNHDPNGGRWSAVDTWPGGVTVFSTRDVEHAEVRRGSELLAVVSGMSFPERHVQENLARRFRRTPGDAYHVAVLHCNVDGDASHGVYAPCTLEDLRESRYDYWALGHIHARRVLQESGPTVVYPGNTQARHPNETGAKGFAVVEVAGGDIRLDWVDTDSWRFQTLECPVDGLTSLSQLGERLSSQALGLGQDRPMVLRARLTGQGPLHGELHRAGVQKSLLEWLREQSPEDLWWDDLRVRTRPPFDRAARLQGEDFTADFLRRVDETDAQQLVSALLGELRGNTSLASVQDFLDLEGLLADAPGLLAEAEALALTALEGKGA